MNSSPTSTIAVRPALGLPLVGIYLAVDTLTQLAFKVAGDGVGDSPFDGTWVLTLLSSRVAWVAAGLYLATFVLWMVILQRAALSRAFPLTALTYVTVPMAGALFFGEVIRWDTVAGIGLILAGMALIGGESAPTET